MVKNKPLLRSTPIKEKVSAKLILKMLEEAEEKNIMLNSIMIIRNGKVITEGYYRNLLGGLYRENPVKSRNYEAVKSSKKWENVGNSYIIPALLLYRYSYI